VFAGAPRDLLPALTAGAEDAGLSADAPLEAPLFVPEGGELRLTLHGHGAGTLALAVQLADGRTLNERTPVDLSGGGEVEHALELPPSGEGVLVVGVSFDAGADDARAELTAASVVGAATGRMPVIFISIDTLSARHLDLYGYARETAPNLTAFAAEGVVFESCWANAPWTTPSYMSQWTGLLPLAHGVGRNDEDEPRLVSPERVTIAEAFQAAGYRTAAFVDNPNLSSTFGLAQGFEVYDVSAAKIPKQDHSGGARKVFADGLAWIDERARGEPFFLILQALDVHGPYAPTPPYRGAFAGDGLGGGIGPAPVAERNGIIFDAVQPYVADAAGAGPTETADTAALWDLYDEEILQLDAALGELFAELAARGLFERALVLVSADHGESLVEHSSLFSHDMPYEEVAHVPLVFRLPGGAEGGRRVADPVQLVDLYPTLLELADLPYRPALHGRSLAPAFAGTPLEPRPRICQGDTFRVQAVEADGSKLVELHLTPVANALAFASYPPVRALFAEHLPLDPGQVPGTTSLPLERLGASNVSSAWAAALEAFAEPRRELFRVARDPAELDDLAGDEPATVERLAALLEAVRTMCAAERRGVSPAELIEMDADLARELQALGYVESR
jgi:arylsulfatase A-like enzyme